MHLKEVNILAGTSFVNTYCRQRFHLWL